MALNDVVFIKGGAGLGRSLPGEDYISGMVFWLTDANLPTGFGTTDRVKEVFSIAEAEALGITEGSATNGILWYHINEFFRIQPQGDLYIGIYGGVGGTVALGDIETVQVFADGKIRQMGVFDPTAFATSAVTTLQTSCDTLEGDHRPMSVLYAADFQALTPATVPDLKSLASKNISVILAEDGANVGAALAVSESMSITTMGATLGAISLSAVNENIGWVDKFNMTSGVELSVPALATGATVDLVKDEASAALLAIKNKGYLFMKSHIGLTGTFHEDSDTSIVSTSDFAVIENNRTIDKATRQVRTLMLPNLNSPITVNADGTLTEGTIARFSNDAARALEQMEVDEEISAFEVVINPAQDVLSTSKIVITIKIVPVGVARTIEINIGFTVSL